MDLHFSKIDLKNAFLQTLLDENSKEFTTINTMFGLYQYNFLPFGLNVSPSVFQETIDAIVNNIDGVKAYQDDLILFAKNGQEHDECLVKLLKRLCEKNVAINASKLVFRVNELEYFGFLVGSTGYCPDPARLNPLMNAPTPVSHAALRSTLGFLQYYCRFIPFFCV